MRGFLGTLLGCVGLGISLCTPAVAQADEATTHTEEAKTQSWFPGSLSGYVGLTSQYVFRGVSESNGNPSLQGGLTWSVKGFHLGFEGSTVDFNDGGLTSLELPFIAGYGGDVGTLFSYDVGALYFWYPGAPSSVHYDFKTFYGLVSHDFGFAAVDFLVDYSPNSFGHSGPSTFLQGGLHVPLTPWLAFSGTLGHYDLKPPAVNYTEWAFGFEVNVKDWFHLDLRYHNTNIRDGCPTAAGKHLCDGRFVGSIRRTF